MQIKKRVVGLSHSAYYEVKWKSGWLRPWERKLFYSLQIAEDFIRELIEAEKEGWK